MIIEQEVHENGEYDGDTSNNLDILTRQIVEAVENAGFPCEVDYVHRSIF